MSHLAFFVLRGAAAATAAGLIRHRDSTGMVVVPVHAIFLALLRVRLIYFISFAGEVGNKILVSLALLRVSKLYSIAGCILLAINFEPPPNVDLVRYLLDCYDYGNG